MFAMPPKPLIYVGISLATLALIPPALIARARTRPSENPRIHFIQDMDNQAKRRAQHASELFADGRAMRPPIAGTVARGELRENEHLELGVAGGAWAERFPMPVTRAVIERGRERFAIYCALCHGQAGYGDGMVHHRAMELVDNPAIGNGTQWVQPKNIHDPEVRNQPAGQIYNTITNGIRNMSGYEAQIPLEDRWAIAAWVKVLQRSQSANPGDVPGGGRDLELRNLVPPAEGEG